MAPEQLAYTSPMNEALTFTVDPLSRRKRILCADDNRLVRESLRLILESAAYEVTCADDGQTALKAIRDASEPFDLLITDHDMPRLCGLELVSQLDADRQLPEVVVISGNLTTENITEYERLGVRQVLEKPFLIPTILDAVHAGCERAERRKAAGETTPPMGHVARQALRLIPAAT